MARKWRPGCWIKNPDYRPGEYWSKQPKTIWVSYPTYRELKKNLKDLFKRNDNQDIHVSRTRRGEWGEWFEIWEYNGGNPVIQKQGWQ